MPALARLPRPHCGALLASAVALATLAAAPLVNAQTQVQPAPVIVPKVCVAVAGDPDTAVTDFAGRLHALLSARSDVRVVADARARAALLGVAAPPPAAGALAEPEHPLRAARATLSFGDADAPTLDSLADRLGCALVVEMSARPAGLAARGYDALTHRTTFSLAPGVVDPRAVEQALVAPAAVALAVASAAPPAPTLALPPTSSAPSAPPARSLLAPVTPVDHDATADVRNRVAPDVLAPRPSPEAPRARMSPWPWVVAGGAAAALITGFLVAQAVGPASAVVTVSRTATGASP